MHRTPAVSRPERLRAAALRVVLAGFLVRALIPAGFMPAPLDSGGPVVLCHGGLAGAFFDRLAEARPAAEAQAAGAAQGVPHDHQAAPDAAAGVGHAHPAHADLNAPADDPDAGHTGWEHCPVGASFAAAPLALEYSIELLALGDVLARTEPSAAAPAAFVASYRARAPPVISRHAT